MQLFTNVSEKPKPAMFPDSGWAKAAQENDITAKYHVTFGIPF